MQRAVQMRVILCPLNQTRSYVSQLLPFFVPPKIFSLYGNFSDYLYYISGKNRGFPAIYERTLPLTGPAHLYMAPLLGPYTHALFDAFPEYCVSFPLAPTLLVQAHNHPKFLPLALFQN